MLRQKLVAMTVCLAAWAEAALAPPAAAVPIGVRARTSVTLEHHRQGRSLVLVGRFVDDRDQPIAGENLTLEIPGLEPESRLTDSAGRFEVRLGPDALARLAAMHGQKLPWTIRFDGSSRLGSATAEGVLDIAKAPTRLVVSLPESVVIRDDRQIPIGVALTLAPAGTAGSDEAGPPLADAEIQLRVGSGEALVGKTGSTGRATFVLRPTLLDGAGSYMIVARFPGDAQHAGSVGKTELTVVLPTRLTIRVAREGDDRQARYRFSGRLSDENGPLAEAPIVIRGTRAPRPPSRQPPRQSRQAHASASSPTASVFEVLTVTGADGVYVAGLPAEKLYDLADEVITVRAAYAPPPADVRHRGASSRAVDLKVPPPPGVPLGWYAFGVLVVLTFLAFLHALRTHIFGRAWAQLLLAWRAWRLRWRRPLSAAPNLVEPPFVTPVEDADPSHRRLPNFFAGSIIDAHRRHPLPGARAVVRGGPGLTLATTVGPDGRFALGPVEPGAWVLHVSAPGYVSRELAVSVPHGGDYDGAYYALVAAKRKVREIFGEATAQLGAPASWGFDTPREAAARALLRTQAPLVAGLPLSELTALVERAHFAPESVGEAEVERARALREELP